MNHQTSLFERIFTEAEKPTFMGSVHEFVKAADISDPTHPWHQIFTKIGEIGHALKSGASGGSSDRGDKSSHGLLKQGPLKQVASGPRSGGLGMSSARQALRAVKRDTRAVGRSRARQAREGKTLRAMGRAQAGTGPRRQTTQRRRRVPGMGSPIR